MNWRNSFSFAPSRAVLDATLVDCPVCNIHVPYTNLRVEHPKCPNDHPLGTWVFCQNAEESHVYLSPTQGEKCPYCGSSPNSVMKEGNKVKCLHVTNEGMACPARAYVWIKEGPPCFMNHIAKMRVESSSSVESKVVENQVKT